MCSGVLYKHDGKTVKTYFPVPGTTLPVHVSESEDLQLYPWGRRKEEQGRLWATGWARRGSIESGKWQPWQPVPVRIMVDRFMEKDHERTSHWFDLQEEQWIAGLLATCQDEMRVYVVTTSPSDPRFKRWPELHGAG